MNRLAATTLLLLIPIIAGAFYSPQMRRWTTRDPIGEKGGVNLYAFVENAAVINVDAIGMYTLGDAEDSLIERGVPMSGSTWFGNEYSDKQIFLEWLRLERTRGAWWSELPQCPSKLCIRKNGKPANPDSLKWKDPSRGGSILAKYHPGGVYEMRSLPVNGHGNQCVYDGEGNILTGPPAGGTVDWAAPGWGYFWGHGPHDVYTYEKAVKLHRVKLYYAVRPSW